MCDICHRSRVSTQLMELFDWLCRTIQRLSPFHQTEGVSPRSGHETKVLQLNLAIRPRPGPARAPSLPARLPSCSSCHFVVAGTHADAFYILGTDRRHTRRHASICKAGCNGGYAHTLLRMYSMLVHERASDCGAEHAKDIVIHVLGKGVDIVTLVLLPSCNDLNYHAFLFPVRAVS